MAYCKVVPYDEVYVQLEGPDEVLREIWEQFSFPIPNRKFHPKVKARIWNGYIHLLNLRTGLIYRGLLKKLEEFCKKHDWEFRCGVPTEYQFDRNDLDEFIKDLNLSVEPRDYQIESTALAAQRHRGLFLSPTASGKSLMMYLLIRYLNLKTLLVVPSINLVSQMYDDFKDYSTKNGWDVDVHCSKIKGGMSKENLNQITISTWQSIHELPKEWFDGFDVVIIDEADTAKAKSLTNLLEKMSDAHYRFGFTGTLDDHQVHHFVLEGLFGEITRLIQTQTLIQRQNISDLEITCLLLNYNDKSRQKIAQEKDYRKEIDFIVSHQKRNELIANLAASLKGNTMVLYNLVEKHGKVLKTLIDEKNKGDKKVFFVAGEIKDEERQEIRQTADKDKKDCVIVASLGTFSRGTNIVHIHNIITAHPFKAKVRLLQSIGRGLRRGGEKNRCSWIDIVDDLNWKKRKNYAMKHSLERIKIYKSEGFAYKARKIKIEE